MKKLLIILTVIVMASCQQKTETKKTTLDNEMEKVSYAIGVDVAKSIQKMEEGLDLKSFNQGFQDAYKGEETIITEEEMTQAINDFRKKKMMEMQEKQKMQGEKNLTEGKAFLESNKSQPGVKTTDSGLQYVVMTEGKGDKPKATDVVTVHYRGTLLDGTEFDSSYSRGQPASFPLNGVIKGWTEGLQLMKKGSKYKFFIPSELAYGPRGAGQDIGPNATLIFEVELLDIESK
jgi:FKBP-type peptidyl-prolyl cis-trans isomerase